MYELYPEDWGKEAEAMDLTRRLAAAAVTGDYAVTVAVELGEV